MYWEITSKSASKTEQFGQSLGQLLAAGDIIGLDGDLGAGKTAFVRGVAVGLDVPENILVSSPTFALLHEYPGRLLVVHSDLYRLSREDDLIEIGLQDHYGGDGVCLVEWFDRFPAMYPESFLHLTFSVEGDNERTIRAEPIGQRYNQLCQDWFRLGDLPLFISGPFGSDLTEEPRAP